MCIDESLRLPRILLEGRRYHCSQQLSEVIMRKFFGNIQGVFSVGNRNVKGYSFRPELTSLEDRILLADWLRPSI